MAITLEQRLRKIEAAIKRIDTRLAKLGLDGDGCDDIEDDIEMDGGNNQDEELIELYKGKHAVEYSQVALVDTEDEDSYPVFETGEEAAFFGDKGVAVATATDRDVEIIVYQGEGKPKEQSFFVMSGTIEVGVEGLTVGNETTADTAQVSYLDGETFVSIYANSKTTSKITQVVFVLS